MDANNIYRIMDRAIEAGASDIHLTDRVKPILRVDGELFELIDFETCNPASLRLFTEEITPERLLEKYTVNKNLDMSFEYNNMRFRIHIYRQRECDAFSLRLIPKAIPKLSNMGLPTVLNEFIKLRNGLVLITGITGSGKSTTLAAMIGEINRKQRKHIITIEDPIEFVHEHGTSIINQREVGSDVHSFSDAVKSAMREDPDILLVGELRDIDTIANAITMAETGHLVFGTLHTRSVAESIDRIIDVFPPSQQEQIRIQLANSIGGIVSQELLPKLGGGRVALCEILVPDDGVRSLIREHGTPNAILDHIQFNSNKTGSVTRLNSLARLVAQKKVSYDYGLSMVPFKDKENYMSLVKIYQEGK